MHDEFFNELRKDHKLVKQILKEMEESSPKERADLISELDAALFPHLRAEEEVFYPALMQKEQSRELGLEAIEEHHVAKIVYNELSGMSPSDEKWQAKAKVLMEIVNHHIQEEEEEVFSITKKAISKDDIPEVFQRFVDLKQFIMEQMGVPV